MPTLNDTVLDQALNYLETNGTRLDICSQEPTTYAEATSTYTLGNATSITYTGPVDGDTSGRKTTVDALSGESVTGTGTATHYAITDGSSVLLKTGDLASGVAVTSGGTFNLAAFDVLEIADVS